MNNKQDILNELKLISPLLLKIKEEQKEISIPKNYFDELADVVMFQINEEESVLSSLKKNNLSIPENYFENFSDIVLSKIKVENKTLAKPKQQNKIISLFKRVAVAASIVGVVFLIKQIKTPTTQAVNDCPDGIACLTQEEIYDYMNTNSHEFDVHDVEKTVQSAIENNVQTTTTTNNSDTEDVSKYIEINIDEINANEEQTDIF